MNYRNENKQDLPRNADELIRSYRVPASRSKQEALDMLLSKIGTGEDAGKAPVRTITWFRAAVSVAATVAVIVTFWLFIAAETVSSRAGETFAFRLPDDSRVILHNESSLSYRKYMWKRNVKLEGEAYFEVEKGNGFKVITGNGNVEVLGTRFLVKEEDNRFIVQCYQGKVKAGFTGESWILEPGTELAAKNQKAEKKAIEADVEYPQFARFSKSFENVPLPEVLAEVEAFFGVNIHRNGISGMNFTGTVETGNLENVLRIITIPLQLDYVFEDKYNIKLLN
jgi:transmembrane sensor